MTTSSLKTHQPTTKQDYRHVVMIVAGLLFVVSAISSLVIQDWRNVTIAMILVVLVFAPILAERWVNLIVPTSLQVQYALLLLTGPYLGGYWRC